MMRFVIRFAVLVACALGAGAGAAHAAGSEGPRWACWYAAHDLTVRCLLVLPPATEHAERRADVENAIDPRLSGLVRQIWGSPEQLAGRHISIPLWNVPYEMSFARELAESVMCGIRSDCAVMFDANADGRAALRAAALAAQVAESEVLAAAVAEGLTVTLAAAEPAPVAAEQTPPRKSRRWRWADSEAAS